MIVGRGVGNEESVGTGEGWHRERLLMLMSNCDE